MSGPVVKELAEQAERDGRFGLDTEFVSERRYRPLLCLVQVVVGDRIEILDPLGDLDARPLAKLLADPEIEVVLHAGRQDVAILKRSWATEITNIFDTQVAAGFAGYGAQSGYDSLVRSLLGVSAKGAEGFSRWDRRPLTRDQITYARADVEHLLPMADALQERLRESGRLEWAREECRALERASDERSPEEQFARLPRVRRLGKRQRAVALTLVDWRQRLAQDIDRPASSVLPDHVLVEVARRQPDSRRALEEVRGMPGQTFQRWHRELLDAVARGREAPDAPSLPDVEPGDSADAPLIALGQALVRQRALEAKVAVDLVSTQSDIAAVVGALRRRSNESGDGPSSPALPGGEPDVRTLQGWRRELVGEELLKLLTGDCVVRVRDRRLTIEPTS